jgi:hypothetical protein
VAEQLVKWLDFYPGHVSAVRPARIDDESVASLCKYMVGRGKVMVCTGQNVAEKREGNATRALQPAWGWGN